MKYFEVSVSTVHALADTVAAVLFGCGSEGVATYDKQDLVDLIREGKTWDYIEDDLLEADGGVVIVKGFFPDDAVLPQVREAIGELRAYNAETGSLEVTAQWLDDADYADEWKKYYKTIVIGRIAVVPRWLEPTADKLNVLIDPGPAFGTGSHETTAMCLGCMQGIDLAGKSVIDLGCGSGILGLAALRLGAASVAFVDVDPMALDVSKANVALNDLTDRASFFCGDIRTTDLCADVLFANITADVLCMLSEDLPRHLAAGGTLLLSGIIDREAERVGSTFSALGFATLAHERAGEWHSLLLKRPS